MEYAGKDFVIKVGGEPTVMTDEATTTTDNKSYQITNSIKRILDWETAPVVYDDGLVTVETYTVDYMQGIITFATVDALRTVTVSGKYMPMSIAATANSASTSINADMLDITAFGQDYRKRQKGLMSASGSLSQFDVEDTTFIDALVSGERLVLEQSPESTESPTRLWVLMESNEVQAAIDGLQTLNVSWVSYDEWLKL